MGYDKEKKKKAMRAYQIKNRVKIREYQLRWQRENKDKTSKYNKRYRINNKEKARQATRKWRLENKEREAQRMRKYQRNNREKINNINLRWYYSPKGQLYKETRITYEYPVQKKLWKMKNTKELEIQNQILENTGEYIQIALIREVIEKTKELRNNGKTKK